MQFWPGTFGKNTLHQPRLGQYLDVINRKFPLTWGWEDGVLVQERVRLRWHLASWRVSVEVRRRGGGRVIGVVGKVHDGLAKVGQRVKGVFQELRGLQSRDGRRHVRGGRGMLLWFQLSAGLQRRGQGLMGNLRLRHAQRHRLVMSLLSFTPPSLLRLRRHPWVCEEEILYAMQLLGSFNIANAWENQLVRRYQAAGLTCFWVFTFWGAGLAAAARLGWWAFCLCNTHCLYGLLWN